MLLLFTIGHGEEPVTGQALKRRFVLVRDMENELGKAAATHILYEEMSAE